MNGKNKEERTKRNRVTTATKKATTEFYFIER